MRLKELLLIFLTVFSVEIVQAQNFEYGVTLDTNQMLIGDQQYLTFQVLSEKPINIDFPILKDTVTSMVEIVEGPIYDSIRAQNGGILYQAKYLITSFDTGVHVIPPMPIVIKSDDYNNVLQTQMVGFAVGTMQIDEQKGNFDIVPPINTPLNFAEILPYLLYGLGGLILVALGIWIYLRYKKNKPIFSTPKPIIPPYELAVQAFQKLDGQKLWQNGKVKEYYTELTDILRAYINGELKIPATEQTSLEILQALSNSKYVNSTQLESLTKLLETADFVKFAKMQPLSEDNSQNYTIAYEFVNDVNVKLSAEKQQNEIKATSPVSQPENK